MLRKFWVNGQKNVERNLACFYPETELTALKGSFILTEEMYGASLRKEATVHLFPGRNLLGSLWKFRMGFRRWQSGFTWSLFYEAGSLNDIGPDLCTPPCFPSVSGCFCRGKAEGSYLDTEGQNSYSLNNGVSDLIV